MFDPAKCVESMVEIAIQINGKLRGRMQVAADISAADAVAAARAEERIAPLLDGMQTVKELYVPGKLVNLVVRPQ